ncbi:hypothetical protein [Sphingomonas sp. R86521]|uniref:hypothetical protein n=1 Tax=Sphingomonas sp. R86521 TaxID=3093860 RepID=UPI0036D2D942
MQFGVRQVHTGTVAESTSELRRDAGSGRLRTECAGVRNGLDGVAERLVRFRIFLGHALSVPASLHLSQLLSQALPDAMLSPFPRDRGEHPSRTVEALGETAAWCAASADGVADGSGAPSGDRR